MSLTLLNRERKRERAGKICHVPMLIHKQTNDPWVISPGQIETLLYIGGHALIQKIFWGWEGGPIENCVFQERGGIFSIILLFEFKNLNFPGGTLSLDTPSLDSCIVGNGFMSFMFLGFREKNPDGASLSRSTIL